MQISKGVSELESACTEQLLCETKLIIYKSRSRMHDESDEHSLRSAKELSLVYSRQQSALPLTEMLRKMVTCFLSGDCANVLRRSSTPLAFSHAYPYASNVLNPDGGASNSTSSAPTRGSTSKQANRRIAIIAPRVRGEIDCFVLPLTEGR
jgi:hypothetical protein